MPNFPQTSSQEYNGLSFHFFFFCNCLSIESKCSKIGDYSEFCGAKKKWKMNLVLSKIYPLFKLLAWG